MYLENARRDMGPGAVSLHIALFAVIIHYGGFSHQMIYLNAIFSVTEVTNFEVPRHRSASM